MSTRTSSSEPAFILCPSMFGWIHKCDIWTPNCYEGPGLPRLLAETESDDIDTVCSHTEEDPWSGNSDDENVEWRWSITSRVSVRHQSSPFYIFSQQLLGKCFQKLPFVVKEWGMVRSMALGFMWWIARNYLFQQTNHRTMLLKAFDTILNAEALVVMEVYKMLMILKAMVSAIR